jgi:3-oxoacyl-[acyl-carrier protein] reductase
LLAADGARIVISDVDEAESTKTVEELRAKGYEIIAIVGNLLEEQFSDVLVKKALETWGQINILVNGAGTLKPPQNAPRAWLFSISIFSSQSEL